MEKVSYEVTELFYRVCCRVLQMYGLIWLTDLRNKLSRIDLLIMLTSALCHDLDHPGYNNVYQVTSPPFWSGFKSVLSHHRGVCLLFICVRFLNFSQINAQTDLALRYNDISPLENHHCAVAFSILFKVQKYDAPTQNKNPCYFKYHEIKFL